MLWLFSAADALKTIGKWHSSSSRTSSQSSRNTETHCSMSAESILESWRERIFVLKFLAFFFARQKTRTIRSCLSCEIFRNIPYGNLHLFNVSLSPSFRAAAAFCAGWHRSHPRSIIITTTINDMHRMDEKQKLFFWPNRNDGTIHITREKPSQRLESRAVCEQINKQTANETMMVVEQTTGWYEITIIFHDFSLLSM